MNFRNALGIGSLMLAWLVPVTAVGQGQFYFNNRIGTEVNARFINSMSDPINGSVSSIGFPDWIMLLYGGPEGTSISQLVPLDPSSTGFRGAAGTAEAGYVVPVTVTVPGVGVGQDALVLLKLFGPSGFCTTYGAYSVTLGGGTVLPPNLQLGTFPLGIPVGGGSGLCVPEPNCLLLFLFAIASAASFAGRFGR